MITRRTLLATLAGAALHGAGRSLRCDVAVIGGGFGGCAAALGALRNGMRVVLTEETDWVGGQVTSQLVPPDEHPWIEAFGGTRAYRGYRTAVRQYYKAHYPLTAEARGRAFLNPGDGSVSKITHEPRVSLAVLEELLAPYVSGGWLTVLLKHELVSADVDGDRVRGVLMRSLETGDARTIEAACFLDATEQGDLLPLAKVEYVTGFEAAGEPHAPKVAQPDNIQSFTVCFAMDYRKGEDHTIDKPEDYAFWRDYVPRMTPAWPGKLLGWAMSNPQTYEERKVVFDPEVENPKPGFLNLWLYRRIAAARNFVPGAYRSDVSLVNWPQNDYWLGNLHNVSKAVHAKHLRGGKQLSLSLLYWMQTEAGFKGLRLRGDVAGTEDGLAKYPYIRESRRIQAEFTVLEQHVGTEARRPLTTAETFPDTVGVGSYRIDLHPSSGGDNYVDVSSLPFQIPMGALIPKRVENVLAACKNLGVTHITNGCYRLHPVEWNIGESAGMLAAAAVAGGVSPRGIRGDAKRLRAFQAQLEAQGVELRWPAVTAR